MTFVKILEWLCFSSSLLCVYAYGRGRYLGPVVGCCTAILFMAYGTTAGVWAAAISNIFFLGLHARNYVRARSTDPMNVRAQIKSAVDTIVRQAHGVAKASGWWDEYESIQDPKVRRWWVATKLCLVHSEVSEAMEGDRKDKMDDHLPHRSMLEVELADAVIRIADLAGGLGLDLGGAIAEKMEYNATRPDHKRENRAAAGGKVY